MWVLPEVILSGISTLLFTFFCKNFWVCGVLLIDDSGLAETKQCIGRAVIYISLGDLPDLGIVPSLEQDLNLNMEIERELILSV